MTADRSSGWGRVLVIVPTFNEIESLERVIGTLVTTVPDVDVLIVDDMSPDGTGALADSLAAADPRIRVLHRTGQQTLARAYLDGFAWARSHGYDVLVEMDADGSHPAATLPDMLDALGAPDNPGLVIGSRWIPGGSVVNWPASRQLLSRAGNLYARLALGIPIRDSTAGFRAYRADVIDAVAGDSVRSRGYCFQIDMAMRAYDAGYGVVEVPIEFREREAGVSKMKGAIVVEAMSRVTVWGVQRRARAVRRLFGARSR